MEIATVVFEHGFDKAMLDQIDTLRTIRLGLAEQMLKDLDGAAGELAGRGLVHERAEQVNRFELRHELEARARTLRERLKHPDVIYEDEINMYVELLEGVNSDLEPLTDGE